MICGLGYNHGADETGHGALFDSIVLAFGNIGNYMYIRGTVCLDIESA